MPMAKLDLDARRAARSEADNTPHEVTLDGHVYPLRARMPVEFTQLLGEGKLVDAVKLILVDPDDWEQMRQALPDDDDLLAIAGLYAVDLPESPASPPTSGNGGRTSRPTSRAIITSTSQPAASGRKRSGSAGSTP
jgi:hypothetical protein